MLLLLLFDIFKLGVVLFIFVTVYAIWSGRIVEWFQYLGLAPIDESHNCDDDNRS